MTRSTFCTLAVAPLACLLLLGCHVNGNVNGSHDNVRIDTPLGSMHIKTDNSTETSDLGLTAYPGAVALANNSDKDNNSANVDLSFGSFHLRVKAASFQTPDQQDKILTFYRKDMAARYGDVIECRGNESIGSPTRTAEGLTCQTARDNHVHLGADHDTGLELRAGSEQHQHIVSVDAHDGGTKIGLVALDLPSSHSKHGIE